MPKREAISHNSLLEALTFKATRIYRCSPLDRNINFTTNLVHRTTVHMWRWFNSGDSFVRLYEVKRCLVWADVTWRDVFEKTSRGERLLYTPRAPSKSREAILQLGAARRQFKYGQLTNQIDRPTNQIFPFAHERDILKEQGLASGVLSPLLPSLPPPPSSNFCWNACNAG